MAIEIVDLPIKIVIFHSYVSLPEGISSAILFINLGTPPALSFSNLANWTRFEKGCKVI